tara:strand:+ start:53 stop:1027 length:975 start_codon:yes stop_codon:yes gene_type:complete
VYVGACRSGQLYNLINGEHMVNGAMSIEIYGMHIEGGSITLKDCSAHVRDGILFCEENAIGQIILESDNGVYNNRYEVTISNVVFDQSFNRRGGLQQTARPDIVLNPYFTVNINDCKRKITDSNNISIQQYYGVLVGTDSTTMLPAFNNYSHLLSKRCTIANNVPFVDGMIPAQRKTFGGLTGATVTIADAAFNGATGTYYYQAQLLQDPVRLLGRNATNAEVHVHFVFPQHVDDLTLISHPHFFKAFALRLKFIAVFVASNECDIHSVGQFIHAFVIKTRVFWIIKRRPGLKQRFVTKYKHRQRIFLPGDIISTIHLTIFCHF